MVKYISTDYLLIRLLPLPKEKTQNHETEKQQLEIKLNEQLQNYEKEKQELNTKLENEIKKLTEQLKNHESKNNELTEQLKNEKLQFEKEKSELNPVSLTIECLFSPGAINCITGLMFLIVFSYVHWFHF